MAFFGLFLGPCARKLVQKINLRSRILIVFSQKTYIFSELKKIRMPDVLQIAEEESLFTFGRFFFSSTVLAKVHFFADFVRIGTTALAPFSDGAGGENAVEAKLKRHRSH